MKRLMLSAAALLIAAPALAADMGGAEIPDLEERIAELEATTARKGTRKMSVTISGQINKALLWHDIDGLGGTDKARVIDNANSPSVFRIQGDAKMDKFSAGFIYEFGVDSTSGDGLVGHGDDISLRHAAVWLGSPVGKVWLGQTSMATDSAGETTVANTAVASRMLSLDPLWTYSGLGTIGSGIFNPAAFDGDRKQIVKYESPTLAGFMLSASYAPGESATGQDIWDVALRYAGEFSGFRVAAAAGYRVEDLDLGPTFDKVETMVGSASAMHMGTGLFVNVAAGHQDGRIIFDDVLMWQVQAGIERNFFGIGATTAFAEYANHTFDAFGGFGPGAPGIEGQLYGAGVVQAIDGLSADLYAHVRMYDVEGYEAKVGMFGMRIKF